MTGPPVLHVHGDAIRADAARIRAVTFLTPSAVVTPPCGLSPATSAADAFNRAAGQDGLLGDLKRLIDKRDQIVSSMQKAAKAYDDVDEWAARNIEVGVGAPPGTPQMKADPTGVSPPAGLGDAAGGDFLLPVCFNEDTYSDIEAAQAAITAPDDCVSLLAAMTEWIDVAASLNNAASELPTTPSHWDGTAAPAAYVQVAELKQNLITLATAWTTLAGRANGFAAAHKTLQASHSEVYAAYKTNEALAKANPGNNRQYFQAMVEQVAASEEIRDQYGKACVLPRGPLPPITTRTMGSGQGMPGTGGGSPTSWPGADSVSGAGTSTAANASSGGASPSGGGERSAGGAPAQASGKPAAQTAATPQSAQGAESKQPSAGQPSGGQPPGGSPPGGMPGGQTGGLPSTAGKAGAASSPSVRPAGIGGAAGKTAGGAHKAGGGAGRGGSGMGGKPLSPAVSAEGVAPAARGAGPGPGAAESGRAPVGGGLGGGMPMMGPGGGLNQGREKKRSPALSPDENLYTEDRPWTEGVVGHQRREVQGRRDRQGDHDGDGSR